MVLYITQENDLIETVERIFSYIGATDSDHNVLKDPKVVCELFRKEFSTDTCEVKLLYKPKNSITAADMETIINDIEAEGEYEVKFLVHDYLKRLLPIVSKGDMRLDLGEAVNDLSSLSKSKRIPIVSANQLNREAYKVLEANADIDDKENAAGKEKKDLGKRLSLTMQSESAMVSENADAVFGINRELARSKNQWFLTIKDLKMRGSKTNRDISSTYFVHPFLANNSMRLVEDIILEKSYSENGIAESLSGFNSEGSERIPMQVSEDSDFDGELFD
jgi:hypothetical protein